MTVVGLVLHTPTALNSQSNAAVVLFREHHIRLWDIVAEALQAKLGEGYKKTEAKIKGFQVGPSSYSLPYLLGNNSRLNFSQ